MLDSIIAIILMAIILFLYVVFIILLLGFIVFSGLIIQVSINETIVKAFRR